MTAFTFLMEGALKGSLLLLLAGILVLLFRRSSAAVRHLIWTVAIAGAVLVAPLSQMTPAWHLSLPSRMVPPPARSLLLESRLSAPIASPVSVNPGETGDADVSSTPLPASTHSSPGRAVSLAGWIVGFWMGGVIVIAAWFLAGTIRLWRTVRAASAIDCERIAALAESAAAKLEVSRGRFRLRWTEHPLTPMTWGLRRPFILLPISSVAWNEERLMQVLLHEIAHIKRHDLLTQALSSIACILQWFNPLQWWAARQMLVERERACDDVVLREGATPSAYAHELLEVARSLGAGWTTSRVSTAMARRSQISGRLLAILDAGRARYSVGRAAVLVAAILAVGIVLPLSSLAISPTSPESLAVPMMHAAGGSVPPPPSVDAGMEDATREITEAGEKWRKALHERKAHDVAALYTRDAMIVASGRAPARGRSEIERYMQGIMVFGVAEVDVQRVELHRVGDMVCEEGRVTTRTGSGVELGNSSFLSLWKKEEGEWRIHREYVTP